MSLANIILAVTTLTDLGFEDTGEAVNEDSFLFRGGKDRFSNFDERYEVVLTEEGYDITATFESVEPDDRALTVNLHGTDFEVIEEILSAIDDLWSNV